ncbi:hypothetical protein [Aeromicrobium sp. Root472D3]|uniref:hypothetical protein n=1 Tax=Aeromicrobium sp. Root472D3 TaxID=1736540 RepID=UPI0012FB54A0|nr:hypothetical protein [Aeromicrobium sp. Root472D3]
MSNTRFKVLNLIRDARGLNSKEKVFLFVVESRNEMFSKMEPARFDMGLSKNHYYEARASLLDKKLITATRRMDDTTVYTVDEGGLEAWSDSCIGNEAPAEQLLDDPDSRIGNQTSCIRNEDSCIGETKVTLEGNPLSEPIVEAPEDSSTKKDDNSIPPSSLTDFENPIGNSCIRNEPITDIFQVEFGGKPAENVDTRPKKPKKSLDECFKEFGW